MAEQRQTTIVGIFALVALGVLCVLVFIFGGGQTLFADVYDVSVHFPGGVVGIQEGQSVTLHGKRVGQTRAVEFLTDDDGAARPEKGVKVIVAVEAKYNLPAASEVVVASSIMGFGRPAIQIEILHPGDPRMLARDGTATLMGRMIPTLDQVLPPEMQQTLQKATHDLGALASALTPVARNLARLLEARDIEKVDVQELAANLDTVIQRFDATLKNVNTVLGDPQNQANFGASLAQAREMFESGSALMNDLRTVSNEGKTFLSEAGRMTRRLAETADATSAVLARLEQTLAKINKGKGTAALFLNDDRLYEEMVLSARRLTKALDDLRGVLDLAKRGELRIKAF